MITDLESLDVKNEDIIKAWAESKILKQRWSRLRSGFVAVDAQGHCVYFIDDQMKERANCIFSCWF